MMMNLRIGMTEDQILSELHGKVHGETSEEYQLFAQEKFNHIKNQKQLHEVVLANNNYALLIKWNYTRTSLNKLEFVKEYFLSGITDEGNYFVKEIPNFETLFPILPMNILVIVDKINKKDEQFQRLQGDVLCRLIDFAELIFTDENTIVSDMVKPDRFSSVYVKRYCRIRTWIKNVGLFNKRKVMFSNQGLWSFEEYPVSIFGNHIINTDGIVYVLTNMRDTNPNDHFFIRHALEDATEVIITKGTFLELKHNEHDKVISQIPNGKAVFLTPQIPRIGDRKYD